MCGLITSLCVHQTSKRCLPISLLVGLADAASTSQHGLQALLYYRQVTTRRGAPTAPSSAAAAKVGMAATNAMRRPDGGKTALMSGGSCGGRSIQGRGEGKMMGGRQSQTLLKALVDGTLVGGGGGGGVVGVVLVGGQQGQAITD